MALSSKHYKLDTPFDSNVSFVTKTRMGTFQGSFHNPCEICSVSFRNNDNIDRRYFDSCTISHRYAWVIDRIAQPYVLSLNCYYASVHRENLVRAFVFGELISSVGRYSECPHSGD